jgi:predicted permease
MEGFFECMQIPILSGRDFNSFDHGASRDVTIVSRALAERLYPEEDAIGKIALVPGWGEDGFEIVGIVENVRDFDLATDFRPAFYFPFRQFPNTSMRIVVRARGEPADLVPLIRETIWNLEKDAPISNIDTMENRIADTTSSARFSSFLLTTFAVIALIMSATGLYGVLAYFVSERIPELGIRIAIGAAPADIMWTVVKRGILLTGIGLGLGVLAGIGVSQLLRGMLFATEPTDPLTHFIVAAFLAFVAIVACILPAWRATKINPVAALRNE